MFKTSRMILALKGQRSKTWAQIFKFFTDLDPTKAAYWKAAFGSIRSCSKLGACWPLEKKMTVIFTKLAGLKNNEQCVLTRIFEQVYVRWFRLTDLALLDVIHREDGHHILTRPQRPLPGPWLRRFQIQVRISSFGSPVHFGDFQWPIPSLSQLIQPKQLVQPLRVITLHGNLIAGLHAYHSIEDFQRLRRCSAHW